VWVSDDIDPLERQAMMRWTTQLLPPELLGSHIASGRSHTTSRTHDLSFRAATAVFGHLGVEWDLAAASTEELAELGAWVGWYREHRELLHTGTVVRVDEPGEGVLVHGVVSDDLATAVFAWVLTAYPLEDPAPRIVLRGLDPGRSYRIRPVLLGARPDGLHSPTWWGGEPVAPAAYVAHGGSDDLGGRLTRPGVVLPGSALMSAGVAAPRMHPDHVVLLEVTAAEAAASA
jgi:alpha-galactosidase